MVRFLQRKIIFCVRVSISWTNSSFASRKLLISQQFHRLCVTCKVLYHWRFSCLFQTHQLVTYKTCLGWHLFVGTYIFCLNHPIFKYFFSNLFIPTLRLILWQVFQSAVRYIKSTLYHILNWYFASSYVHIQTKLFYILMFFILKW